LKWWVSFSTPDSRAGRRPDLVPQGLWLPRPLAHAAPEEWAVSEMEYRAYWRDRGLARLE
jgi:hypothetical protein